MTPGGRRPSTKRRDVHERALGLLGVRQRSRRELERRLLGGGFGAEEVAAELDRLEEVGLIDDRAFARAVAEHAVGTRAEGRRVVARKLAAAGVAEPIRREILETLNPDGEEERAFALAESRLGRLRGLAPEKAFSRLSGLLARRGYPPDVARRTARRALALDALDD